MAIYHLSSKPIQRSKGRTATASIAYRCGIEMTDERTGNKFDYTKRGGVVSTHLHTPHDIAIDRSQLWNMAETTETRKNSRTAREIIVNLPHELSEQARADLVNDFAKSLVNKYNIACDVAIHLPDEQGDQRNHHAHILMTTRQLQLDENAQPTLADKAQLEMSDTQLKAIDMPRAKDELKIIREQWATMANESLERHDIEERIDHRSHKDRGIITAPSKKMGYVATDMERKGERSIMGDINRQIKDDNKEILALQKQIQDLKKLAEQVEQAEIKSTAPPSFNEGYSLSENTAERVGEGQSFNTSLSFTADIESAEEPKKELSLLEKIKLEYEEKQAKDQAIIEGVDQRIAEREQAKQAEENRLAEIARQAKQAEIQKAEQARQAEQTKREAERSNKKDRGGISR